MIPPEALANAHLAHHSWLSHFLGLDNLSGPFYGWWSGVGSDIGEVAIIGGLISIYRKHNCHARGCWRVGRHTVDGTPYVTCHRHHPEHAGLPKAPTAEEIAQAHTERAA